MDNIIKDLQPTNVLFVIQSTKSDGEITDPTGGTLTIYEENGTDTSFSSTQVTGSPFTITKINSKTGLYGVLIAKTVFTSGKYYLLLWEMTVDGISTAEQETYFFCDAESFKNYAAGAYLKTYTVDDSDGNPLSDVRVDATTDEAGATKIGSSTTDDAGEAKFYLPAGTIYMWRYKSGYTFVNPDEELVE